MKYISILFLLLAISCTNQTLSDRPLNYSLMPEYFDVNTVLPPMTNNDSITRGLVAFKSFPIDSGEKSSKNGIVISPDSAAHFILTRSYCAYLQTKTHIQDTLIRTYYNKSLDAEKVYQEQIKLLQKDVQRTWLEKNIVYFGYVAGLATAILTEWAVTHVAK